MLEDFDKLLNNLSKSAKEDGHFQVYKPGDLYFGSSVPYGVLTGLPELDLALERPGLAAGRVIELFGFEGSGKTSLSLHALAQCQKMGGIGVFVDVEKTLEKDRAEDIGVDLDNNFISMDANSPDAAARAVLKLGESLQASSIRSPVTVVVDSIVGRPDEYTQTKEEIGQESRLGQVARTLRKSVPKIAEMASKTKATIILINHSIEMPSIRGPKSQAAGGHAIKLWSTQRVQLTAGEGKTSKIWDDGECLGQYVWLKIHKNKSAANRYPDIEKVELLYEGGFNTKLSLLRAMVKAGFVEKTGRTAYSLATGEGNLEFDVVEGSRDFTQWYNLIDHLGGIDEAYKRFIEKCIEAGKMKAYV